MLLGFSCIVEELYTCKYSCILCKFKDFHCRKSDTGKNLDLIITCIIQFSYYLFDFLGVHNIFFLLMFVLNFEIIFFYLDFRAYVKTH